MTLSRKQLVLVALLVSVVALVAVWAVASKQSTNKKYALLEDAVASQQFAGVLGEPVHGGTECYPSGESKTCPALIYSVDSSGCKEIAAMLKQDEKDCVTAIADIKYQNKEVTYSLSAGGEKKLRVYVSE